MIYSFLLLDSNRVYPLLWKFLAILEIPPRQPGESSFPHFWFSLNRCKLAILLLSYSSSPWKLIQIIFHILLLTFISLNIHSLNLYIKISSMALTVYSSGIKTGMSCSCRGLAVTGPIAATMTSPFLRISNISSLFSSLTILNKF